MNATARVISEVWLYGRQPSASALHWEALRAKYGIGKARGRRKYKRLKAALEAVREYE